MISFQKALDIVQNGVDQIRYPEQPDNLYAPMRYILTLKGKKIRPVLTILACNLYKEDVSEAIQPALSWEIFHNFTLMHDDVMDRADVRRGQPTVHKVWNDNAAILSGDLMLIRAYQYIAAAPPAYLKELLDLFSVTAAEICEGQQYDMDFENRLDVTEQEYLEMIRLKTAVLIGASLRCGAVIGGASEADAGHLYDFGMNLGLAFQIRDDLLDVYGDPLIFGKNTGGDILCNKKTYFLINALTLTAEKNNQEALLKWLGKDIYNEKEKIRAVTDIYDQLDLRTKAEAKTDIFYHKSLKSLEAVNISAEKKSVLLDLAKQLMERES